MGLLKTKDWAAESVCDRASISCKHYGGNMKLRYLKLSLVVCWPALPLLAQTTIGGGTCDSSTVKGTYAVSLTGRQVSASGTFTSVLQANGAATFDGLNQ